MPTKAELQPLTENPEAVDIVHQRRAITLPQFCAVYGFSLRHYYDRIDEMPPIVRVGKRNLILTQSLGAWESKLLREAEARERSA